MIASNKLRPEKLNNFIGKKEITDSLNKGIQVSKKTQQPLDHILFFGPPGVGKTSLAKIIANELNSRIKIIQSTNIQSVADLIGVLTSLKEFDVLFIDEIHSLKKSLSEILYPALEENVIDIVIGKNYNSKVIRLNLPKFTLIAATTNFGTIEKALEERFGYIFFIDLYSKHELRKIIEIHNQKMSLDLSYENIEIIIENSRGVPRNCMRMLKRIKNHQHLNKKINMKQILKECGYLYKGMTQIDLKYLKFLYQNKNQYSGINSIVQGINLDEKTLIYKVEPFLLKINLITRENKGRRLTEEGKEFVKKLVY